MTAREAVSLIFRYRTGLIICFYIPILLGLLGYFLTPPTYLATAKVLISSFQENSGPSDLEETNNPNTSPLATKQEAINSELEIIASSELADSVIDYFGVRHLFPRANFLRSDGSIDRDGARTAFGASLSADVVKNSNVITLNYESSSPELAREVLNRVLFAYQQAHNAAFTIPVATFLDSQLATMDEKIEGIDSAEADYKAQHQIFDAAQQRQELLQETNELENTAAQLRSHTAELESRITALRQVAATTPVTIQSYSESQQSDAVSHAQSELLDLEVQEKQLETRYNDSSVLLQTIRGQIAAIKSFLSDQSKQFSGSVRTSRNPLYDELQAEIVRAQVQLDPDNAQAAVLDQQINDKMNALASLEQAQIHIDALERARTSTAEALHTYRERQIQAQLQEQLASEQATSIRIIQQATSANHRHKPSLSRYLAISAGLGLLASLIGAAIIFATRNTFIVPETLERRFKIPVIASLPERHDSLGQIAERWQ